LTAVSAATHATRCAAVASRAQQLLRAAPVTPAYRAALAAALGLPSNILSEAPDARWARLVWTCCSAAGGPWEDAVPMAAAVELFMVALDVLDDEEDGDESPLRAELGAARTLNVATGLLLLAQQGLLATAEGATATGILLDAALRACAGQHADLAAEPYRHVSPTDALAVTAGKSAPLVAAACRLGAFAAAADAPTQELYERFGWYLGMAAQLANDLAAIRPGTSGKTDIALGRPTLPLACGALLGLSVDTDAADADTRADLWARGPAQLTWAVAETYCGYARDLIPRLTADHTGQARLAELLRVLGAGAMIDMWA
jgi:geranylgeranyl pyrophosphate synthase